MIRAVTVELTNEERKDLESHRPPQGLARRAHIVLAASAGLTDKEIN